MNKENPIVSAGDTGYYPRKNKTCQGQYHEAL